MKLIGDGRFRLAKRSAGGLTLIELLVAVGLLSIMILCFGKIISEARKTVSYSQATARANNMAMAMDQSLREDIARASQFGFLYIGLDNQQLPSGVKPPVLVCGSVGPSLSVTDAGKTSLCKIASYGLCNSSTGSPGSLYKASWVLNGDGSAPNSTPTSDIWGDVEQFQLQVWPAATQLKTSVVDKIIATTNGYRPANLPTSPDDLTAILQSWKYMASNCKDLDIAWTDGTRVSTGALEGQLNWYSPDATKSWTWTKDNNGAWPKAIKVKFSISDPAMPAGFQTTGLKYEIICPVSR